MHKEIVMGDVPRVRPRQPEHHEVGASAASPRLAIVDRHPARHAVACFPVKNEWRVAAS